jgi:hypothetical protein
MVNKIIIEDKIISLLCFTFLIPVLHNISSQFKALAASNNIKFRIDLLLRNIPS